MDLLYMALDGIVETCTVVLVLCGVAMVATVAAGLVLYSYLEEL